MAKVGFCIECRKETEFKFKRTIYKKCIKDKEYEFEITTAVCCECGEEMNITGLMDRNAQEIDEQYRQKEKIVSIADIQKLMEIYRIGKAPVSLALGFGEVTITRYLEGQIPSKEYSDIIKRALESPKFMMELLQQNMKRIGETAYKKSMKAAEEINTLFNVSDKMLLTISYIFEKAGEVTPLALQKILYYIEGLHMFFYDAALYAEDCQAWVHGPVYENVYKLFKDFKYNPIEDNRFAIFKNRFEELSMEEKEVIELVVETFGMYSGKTLEQITHSEMPWQDARKNYLPNELSNEIISKDKIKDYFRSVAETYDIRNISGIKRYIGDRLSNKS